MKPKKEAAEYQREEIKQSGGGKQVKLKKVVESVKAFAEEVMLKPCRVIAVAATEKGWLISAEVIEEDEYMRRRARKDLLGIYEFILDEDLTVLSYQRKELKERGSL